MRLQTNAEKRLGHGFKVQPNYTRSHCLDTVSNGRCLPFSAGGVLGYAGTPRRPSTQTGFGALTYTTAPPTGLLGAALGGDSAVRMIAFQARIQF
jgi:hypothetical protein